MTPKAGLEVNFQDMLSIDRKSPRRNSGKFSYYGQTSQSKPSSNLSTEEAYKILGLKKGCTKEEIIKAANGLQKKIHPDVNPNSNTERLSQIVNEAKETTLKYFS